MNKIFRRIYSSFLIEMAKTRIGIWIRSCDKKYKVFDLNDSCFHGEFVKQHYESFFKINGNDIYKYIESISGNVNDGSIFTHYVLVNGYGIRVNITLDNKKIMFIEGLLETVYLVKRTLKEIYEDYEVNEIVLDIFDKKNDCMKNVTEQKAKMIIGIDE